MESITLEQFTKKLQETMPNAEMLQVLNTWRLMDENGASTNTIKAFLRMACEFYGIEQLQKAIQNNTTYQELFRKL